LRSLSLSLGAGSDEQRQEWRRCLSEGPTILEAREMRYKDLCALLSVSHRNVLLSKKQVRERERERQSRASARREVLLTLALACGVQVTELHERETITGRIVILPGLEPSLTRTHTLL
jgi:hypothetical protein